MKAVSEQQNTQGNELALVDAPDRNNYSFGAPKSLTYNEVEAASWSLACELFDAGIRRGDVALVQLPNIAEHVVADIALKMLGATVEPIEMYCTGEVLGKIAGSHAVKAYISTTDYKGESFTCTHQAAFPDGTLIFAFGDEEPESAQLIGETSADIEALDSCQAYINKQIGGSKEATDCAAFPIDLAHQHFSSTG